jgi:hypothetical protein
VDEKSHPQCQALPSFMQMMVPFTSGWSLAFKGEEFGESTPSHFLKQDGQPSPEKSQRTPRSSV